jgi:hypothetical protein
MKTGFKDPIASKGQKPKSQPMDGKNSPWDFRCPPYDQRHSNFVNAGTHYGVGQNVNIGHRGPTKNTVSVMPFGKVSTEKTDEKG